MEKDRKNVGGNEVHDEKLANTLGNLFINKRVTDFGDISWTWMVLPNYIEIF